MHALQPPRRREPASSPSRRSSSPPPFSSSGDVRDVDDDLADDDLDPMSERDPDIDNVDDEEEEEGEELIGEGMEEFVLIRFISRLCSSLYQER